jgi:hypothetical protein
MVATCDQETAEGEEEESLGEDTDGEESSSKSDDFG